MRIALVCFDDMEELDLVGPWEVLRMWQLQHSEDGVEVFTVSLHGTRYSTVLRGRGVVPSPLHTVTMSATRCSTV